MPRLIMWIFYYDIVFQMSYLKTEFNKINDKRL